MATDLKHLPGHSTSDEAWCSATVRLLCWVESSLKQVFSPRELSTTEVNPTRQVQCVDCTRNNPLQEHQITIPHLVHKERSPSWWINSSCGLDCVGIRVSHPAILEISSELPPEDQSNWFFNFTNVGLVAESSSLLTHNLCAAKSHIVLWAESHFEVTRKSLFHDHQLIQFLIKPAVEEQRCTKTLQWGISPHKISTTDEKDDITSSTDPTVVYCQFCKQSKIASCWSSCSPVYRFYFLIYFWQGTSHRYPKGGGGNLAGTNRGRARATHTLSADKKKEI